MLKCVYFSVHPARLNYFSVDSQHLMFAHCSSGCCSQLVQSQASRPQTVTPVLRLVAKFWTGQTLKPAVCESLLPLFLLGAPETWLAHFCQGDFVSSHGPQQSVGVDQSLSFIAQITQKLCLNYKLGASPS